MKYLFRSILLLTVLMMSFVFFAAAQENETDKLFKIKVDGKYGFKNKTGKIVIYPKINAVGEFSEGLAEVILPENNYRFGFIDKTGTVVIKTNYHLVDDFKDGLAEIQELQPNDDIVNIKYGYIDKTGKVIWQPTK